MQTGNLASFQIFFDREVTHSSPFLGRYFYILFTCMVRSLVSSASIIESDTEECYQRVR